MRAATLLGWAFAVIALAAMVIGHLGDHGLDWRLNQISTYAAIAPYDDLVTSSMLAAAAAVMTVGFLAAKPEIVAARHWSQFAPLLAGAAAAGLVMLAVHEETAANMAILKQSGFQAIREQSFHDAGLQVFFYGALLLVTLLGMLIALFDSTPGEKVLGGLILCSAPLALFLMAVPWTQAAGLAGAQPGLQQRASLFCLWLALVLFLTVAARRASRAPATDASGIET